MTTIQSESACGNWGRHMTVCVIFQEFNRPVTIKKHILFTKVTNIMF